MRAFVVDVMLHEHMCVPQEIHNPLELDLRVQCRKESRGDLWHSFANLLACRARPPSIQQRGDSGAPSFDCCPAQYKDDNLQKIGIKSLLKGAVSCGVINPETNQERRRHNNRTTEQQAQTRRQISAAAAALPSLLHSLRGAPLFIILHS